MNRVFKKLLPSAVIVLLLTFSVGMSAMAELVPALDNYDVSFTKENTMKSNFKSQDMYNQAAGLQPGDYTDIVLNLKNENKETVDWYMTNKVISSLEDTRADDTGLAGGAYTYILTFKNSKTKDEKILFSSDAVGGEEISAAGEGLHEATDALKDWLYLDTFKQGEGGVLTLRVALDGETQGNDYQDTLAELQMNFAVELNKREESNNGSTKKKNNNSNSNSSSNRSSSNGGGSNVVRTGDETNMVPYFIAAGISGIFVLFLAIYSLRERRRQEGGKV
ncbi:MAG: hypothetical protein Q4F43_05450 [Eubacteriales bacterium]|nr:hypothetical protein [Eubacteriales bacterium]